MTKLGKLLGLCVASGALLTACGPTPAPAPTNEVADTPAVENTLPADNAVAADNAVLANDAEETAAFTNEAAPAPVPTPAPAAAPPAPAPAPAPAAAKPATPTPPPAPAAEAPKVAERPAQFSTCTVCHTIDKGGPNKIGPNLFGVVGSKAGSKPGFAYSDAMTGSGITWTPDELLSFLLAPQTKVPGTKMTVKGPADEKARQAIVDYLATLK